MTHADPFMNPTAAAILRILYENPHREWCQRELVKHLRRSQSTIEYEMSRMVSAGVIAAERRGRKVLYKPHPTCSIHNELRSILMKTYGVSSEIREMLMLFKKKIDWAFIRDEGQLIRDFDCPIRVAVIGTLDFDCHIEFDEECWKLSKRLGRPIKFEKEHRSYFDSEVRARDSHAMGVIHCKKIWLLGDEKGLLALTRPKATKQ
jgi:DNA-binding transcriptional ArsR family regulator